MKIKHNVSPMTVLSYHENNPSLFFYFTDIWQKHNIMHPHNKSNKIRMHTSIKMWFVRLLIIHGYNASYVNQQWVWNIIEHNVNSFEIIN